MPRYSEDELKKLLRDNQDVAVPEWDTVDVPAGTEKVYVYPEPKKRKSKYNAVRVEVDGYTFDSRKEANRYLELRQMERDGEIAHLILQPRYELVPSFCDSTGKKQRGIEYIGDFEYVKDGKLYIEDVKSRITAKNAAFRLKMKMILYKYRDNPRIVFVIHD